jgi:hypothetical protein
MTLTTGRNTAQRITAVGAILAAVLIGTSATALAYGPPPPPPPGPPGGYECIVTSETISPSGGIVGPLQVGTILVTLTIPPGAFSEPAQVTITEPYSLSGGCNGGFMPAFRHLRVVGGVGVLAEIGNSPVRYFPTPLFIRIQETKIIGFSTLEVVPLGGNGGVVVIGKHSHNPVTLKVRRPTDYVVLVNGRLPGCGCHTTTGRRFGHYSLAGGDVLTAALQPAGQRLPGLGVLISDSGLALSSGSPQAGAR